MEEHKKTVFILSISSDIGYHLARYFTESGYRVIGTYRHQLKRKKIENVDYIPCDISKDADIDFLTRWIVDHSIHWDIFISAVGDLRPIGRFFEIPFNEWEASVNTNSIRQLKVIHALYSFRNSATTTSVVFFAGGGTNSAFRNYSAYCISKVMLIKMCELLADEYPDTNFFISGTGWVNTKIHKATLEAGKNAEENLDITREFLSSNATGTTFREIFEHILWAIEMGSIRISGRNFSIVHDEWRDGGKELIEELSKNPNKFKLRRFGNHPPRKN